MLSETIDELEKVLSCNRSILLKNLGSQLVKKQIWGKNHDATFTQGSKMKGRFCMKHRVKKCIKKHCDCLFKTSFGRPRGGHKSKKLVFHTVKEGMPYDPGETQELMLVEDKRIDLRLYLPPVIQNQVTKNTVDLKESPFTYDPP